NSSVSTIDRGVPVGIPVVGVATTEAPGLHVLLARTGDEHGVGGEGEAYALIGTIVRAREHPVRATRQILEVVAGRTIRIDALEVDRVARACRNVLDRQSELTGPAPLVIGMTRAF